MIVTETRPASPGGRRKKVTFTTKGGKGSRKKKILGIGRGEETSAAKKGRIVKKTKRVSGSV